MSEQLIPTYVIVLICLGVVCVIACVIEGFVTDRPRLKPMSKQELTDLATKAEREAGQSNQPGGV